MKKIVITILICLFVLTVNSQNISTSAHGINVHLSGNDVLAQVKRAGIKWIRIDISWFAIEKDQGNFIWTDVDRVVNYATNNGLSILATLAYTPGWANSNQGINYPSDSPFYWKNFVIQAVNRYRDRIKYWSIWNEPNIEQFFAQGKDVFVEEVFLPAAEMIRASDAGAFIVGPELSHLYSEGSEWYFWLKYILTECGDYIDVVSHHLYTTRGTYYIYELLENGGNFIPSINRILSETQNDDKPFWFSEIGWNTAQFSEAVQAERYQEMLQWHQYKSYPHRLFFYEIRDDLSAGVLPWGILRNNLTHKPAYTVFEDFIAGKVPKLVDLPPTDSKQPCAAEQQLAAPTPRNMATLQSLRSGRDLLLAHSRSGQTAVYWYYRISGELSLLLQRDSRIQRLSRELIRDAAVLFLSASPIVKAASLSQTLSGGLALPPDRDVAGFPVLTPEMLTRMHQFLNLMRQQTVSSELSGLFSWAQSQLNILGKTSVSDYLQHHFNREMDKIEK